MVITKGSLDDNLNKLEAVFIGLQDAGLKVNAAKSFFCTAETEYLGYILTRGGVKPQKKKIQAILALNPPNKLRSYGNSLEWSNITDTCGRSVVKCWPLSQTLWERAGKQKTTKKNKTKKLPWRWDPIHQQAFNNVKSTIAKDVVLAYPDFTKPFEIYTDASTMQLGAVITQDNRPIAFFSRKLSQTQTKYTVTEIELELLAIVETLKEF